MADVAWSNPKPEKLTAKQEAEGKAHMQRVKRLPCVICGRHPPSDVHHVIHGRYSQKKSLDTETIPLCKYHHQWGKDAIHNGQETWEKKYGVDFSYLPLVETMLEQMQDNEI